MTHWIIPSNLKRYRMEDFLIQYGFLDWRQRNKFEVGDIVYLYISEPLQQIKYKMIVSEINLPFESTASDKDFWINPDEYEKGRNLKFCRLKPIAECNSPMLSLENLKSKGFNPAHQSGVKISDEFKDYLDQFFNKDIINDYVPLDSDNELIEGAKIRISANRYERNPLARKLCIEKNGTTCCVCGMNFEKIYGELGKGFIHIHHTTPISSIGKEYKIDYEKDLVPVCPNCHAMLHKGINGEMISVETLKEIIKRQKEL